MSWDDLAPVRAGAAQQAPPAVEFTISKMPAGRSVVASVVVRQGPLSICTSTPAMPRWVAQAVPASTTSPAGTVAPSFGTSIREAVFTGPWADQPFWVQYAEDEANVVRLMSVTHFVAET